MGILPIGPANNATSVHHQLRGNCVVGGWSIYNLSELIKVQIGHNLSLFGLAMSRALYYIRHVQSRAFLYTQVSIRPESGTFDRVSLFSLSGLVLKLSRRLRAYTFRSIRYSKTSIPWTLHKPTPSRKFYFAPCTPNKFLMICEFRFCSLALAMAICP